MKERNSKSSRIKLISQLLSQGIKQNWRPNCPICVSNTTRSSRSRQPSTITKTLELHRQWRRLPVRFYARTRTAKMSHAHKAKSSQRYKKMLIRKLNWRKSVMVLSMMTEFLMDYLTSASQSFQSCPAWSSSFYSQASCTASEERRARQCMEKVSR